MAVASQRLTALLRAVPPHKLKQAEGQRLVLAVQRLQLLVASDGSGSTLAGFVAAVPPRTAIGALALASSVLTVKIWGVKDLGALIGQANALSDSDSYSAPRALADALVAHGDSAARARQRRTRVTAPHARDSAARARQHGMR